MTALQFRDFRPKSKYNFILQGCFIIRHFRFNLFSRLVLIHVCQGLQEADARLTDRMLIFKQIVTAFLMNPVFTKLKIIFE